MHDRSRILIVDDDQEICSLVYEYLVGEGYDVSIANCGNDMRRVIASATVDLVLLDVVLPDDDGLTLARSLRTTKPDIGIIMLTGRGDTIDRIVGLELGADDYLAKPFHLRELLARVKSVSRRTIANPPAEPSRPRVRFAGWFLDLLTRELAAPSGKRIRLTGGEFDLLKAFVTHPNQLLSRDRLLELTRGREAGPFDRTIDVQVGRLRRKLGDNPQQPQLIKTMRSGGYIFAAPVEPAADRGGAGINPAAARPPPEPFGRRAES